MKDVNSTETRHNQRYQVPRLEVEWRAVEGGRYHKSKLLNFSNGGLAVYSDGELRPNEQVAFRMRLPGGVSYVMGRVCHSFETENGETVAGVSLDFFDAREESRFARRVGELRTPRRDYKTCQI